MPKHIESINGNQNFSNSIVWNRNTGSQHVNQDHETSYSMEYHKSRNIVQTLMSVNVDLVDSYTDYELQGCSTDTPQNRHPTKALRLGRDLCRGVTCSRNGWDRWGICMVTTPTSQSASAGSPCLWGARLGQRQTPCRCRWIERIIGDHRDFHTHAALSAVAQDSADVVMGALFGKRDDVVTWLVFRDGVHAIASSIVSLCHFLHVVRSRHILEHCSQTMEGGGGVGRWKLSPGHGS